MHPRRHDECRWPDSPGATGRTRIASASDLGPMSRHSSGSAQRATLRSNDFDMRASGPRTPPSASPVTSITAIPATSATTCLFDDRQRQCCRENEDRRGQVTQPLYPGEEPGVGAVGPLYQTMAEARGFHALPHTDDQRQADQELQRVPRDWAQRVQGDSAVPLTPLDTGSPWRSRALAAVPTRVTIMVSARAANGISSQLWRAPSHEAGRIALARTRGSRFARARATEQNPEDHGCRQQRAPANGRGTGRAGKEQRRPVESRSRTICSTRRGTLSRQCRGCNAQNRDEEPLEGFALGRLAAAQTPIARHRSPTRKQRAGTLTSGPEPVNPPSALSSYDAGISATATPTMITAKASNISLLLPQHTVTM